MVSSEPIFVLRNKSVGISDFKGLFFHYNETYQESTKDFSKKLTSSQIQLILNSDPYLTFLNLKTHCVCSYKSLEGRFESLDDLEKSRTSSKSNKREWEEKMSLYKTLEKVRDYERLNKKGVNGLKGTCFLRIEVQSTPNRTKIEHYPFSF
jgi:hypothetical protein